MKWIENDEGLKQGDERKGPRGRAEWRGGDGWSFFLLYLYIGHISSYLEVGDGLGAGRESLIELSSAGFGRGWTRHDGSIVIHGDLGGMFDGLVVRTVSPSYFFFFSAFLCSFLSLFKLVRG